jgi:hypothetical protein
MPLPICLACFRLPVRAAVHVSRIDNRRAGAGAVEGTILRENEEISFVAGKHHALLNKLIAEAFASANTEFKQNQGDSSVEVVRPLGVATDWDGER